ncbi:hypothetical protein [Spiroplasma endosymbiont of Lonchoptera lutea]|uniref:hypothetical protein n=1 Tax=Spiroplasma endosymbiont of Lonchoptera lutea TaxID=3066297 RepID=UPI0030CD1707
MKKLIGLIGTITIAGSGMAGLVGNAPAIAKNNINYQQTNNLENLSRNKRNIFDDVKNWFDNAGKDTAYWINDKIKIYNVIKEFHPGVKNVDKMLSDCFGSVEAAKNVGIATGGGAAAGASGGGGYWSSCWWRCWCCCFYNNLYCQSLIYLYCNL